MKENPTLSYPFFGGEGGIFLLTAFLRRRRISKYISLSTAVIPINYTGEFREVLRLLSVIRLSRTVVFVKFVSKYFFI